MSKPGPSLSHYLELDGIRAIAALAVFFHHVCYANVGVIPPGGGAWGVVVRLLYRVSAYGYTGVDLFFVLSGFLITSLLIKDRTSPAYYKDFYWKRALRILPVYVLCLAALLFGFRGSLPYVLVSLLFLANFANQLHITVFGPFWSLAIEEQFYLVWPTVVRRRSPAQLESWAIRLWIFVIALRLVTGFFGHFDYILTPLRADGLLAGAFLACRQQRMGLAADKRMLGTFLMGGIVLFTAVTLTHPVERWYGVYASMIATSVVLIASGLIGFAIVYRGSRMLAILRSAPMVFIGAISYAFYMTHAYILGYYDSYADPPHPLQAKSYLLRIAVILGASVALSTLSRYVVELPAISLRRYVLSRPTPPPEIARPIEP